MLFGGEGDGAERVSSVLNACERDGEGEKENHADERVVEEIAEDVDFAGLELPGVDFVEDLQQDEGVEEDAVVLAALIRPLLHADGRLNAEDFGP